MNSLPSLLRAYQVAKSRARLGSCSGPSPPAVGFRLPGFLAGAKNSWASLFPSRTDRSGLHPRNSGQEQLRLLERGWRSRAHRLGCLWRRKGKSVRAAACLRMLTAPGWRAASRRALKDDVDGWSQKSSSFSLARCPSRPRFLGFCLPC